MKQPAVRDAYSFYSTRTSENVRQLAFAAVGVVWIFRPSSGWGLPSDLVVAGALAVGALTLDLLHYVYGTLAWGRLHRQNERAGLDDQRDFKAPRQINWPTNTFFALKVLALVGCYCVLLHHLVGMMV